jgi:hypothetical protein
MATKKPAPIIGWGYKVSGEYAPKISESEADARGSAEAWAQRMPGTEVTVFRIVADEVIVLPCSIKRRKP